MPHSDAPQTVLICDDDPVVLQLAATVLEKAEYQCLTAASEAEAISLFSDYSVDVVLMDIYLGDSNGIDCVRQIRSMPRGGTTPVVFITGSLEPMDVEACLGDDIEASAYLNKPLVWETLPALCNALVSSAKIRAQLAVNGDDPDRPSSLIEGIRYVGEMLGEVIESEEARIKYTKNWPNLGVLVQLNVAHKALLDVESGLTDLLAPSTRAKDES